MDEGRFHEILETELAPLLQGTLAAKCPSTARQHLTSYDGPCRLLVKPVRAADYRIAIRRSQAFTSTERRLAEQFVNELASVAAIGAGAHEGDLLRAIPRRAIAAHLGGGPHLLGVLERLEDWSSQTYEGQRIVASIGLDTVPRASGIQLGGLWDEPFGPVLTNGFDTLIVVGSDGEVGEFLQLSSGSASSTAPYRLREIAWWAEGDRISVVLNRHGEILVFQNRSLRFARRSGRWLHYAHETNIKRMSPPQHRALREAMYESCLDVSFARSGGCLGVVGQAHIHKLGDVVDARDLLAQPANYKTRLLARAVNATSFQALDRRIRLELLSMDGAVVLDRYGSILAAGAIIQVPASSAGGGRRAAAAKLSTLGLGLKISQDGAITGFRSGQEILTA
jgi:hypothetical protein